MQNTKSHDNQHLLLWGLFLIKPDPKMQFPGFYGNPHYRGCLLIALSFEGAFLAWLVTFSFNYLLVTWGLRALTRQMSHHPSVAWVLSYRDIFLHPAFALFKTTWQEVGRVTRGGRWGMPDTAKCFTLAISFNPHLILGVPLFVFYKGGKRLRS